MYKQYNILDDKTSSCLMPLAYVKQDAFAVALTLSQEFRPQTDSF